MSEMEKPIKETGIPSSEIVKPPKWFLECVDHGRQQAVPNTVQQWDEEIEQILIATGDLKEGEHFCTGNCPICDTTKQVFTLDPENEPSISEHM